MSNDVSSTLRRRAATLAVGIAVALATHAVSGASSARAQRAAPVEELSGAALDSVTRALRSSDWNERHSALVRINTAYPSVLPTSLVPEILTLLDRESGTLPDHEGDEDYGEYLVDLVLTGVRTDDARAIPAILALDGLGVSSGVAAFVASHGVAMMPALDDLARTRVDRASDVLETYALMYARYGSRLQRADSVQVLRRLIAAASNRSYAVRSQLALVAPRGPIPELLVPLSALASSDPAQVDGMYPVRFDAERALPTLQRAQASLSTEKLLNRLTLLTDAACGEADGRLHGECTALAAHLAAATGHLAAGQARPAQAALDAYRHGVEQLTGDGLLPRLTGVTLDGTAQAVASRL